MLERQLKKVEQGNTGADVERKEVDGLNSSSVWEPCQSSGPCMQDVRTLDVLKWGMNPYVNLRGRILVKVVHFLTSSIILFG